MVLPPTAPSSISLPSGECTFLATSCHYVLCFEAEKQKISWLAFWRSLQLVDTSFSWKDFVKVIYLGLLNFFLICFVDMGTLMFIKYFLKIEGRCLKNIKQSLSPLLYHSLQKGLDLKAAWQDQFWESSTVFQLISHGSKLGRGFSNLFYLQSQAQPYLFAAFCTKP